MISNEPRERSVITYPVVWYDDVFTEEELDSLVEYCEAQGFDRAKVGHESVEDNNIRRCDIKFHKLNKETAWFFKRMNEAIVAFNTQFYGFDLTGYDAFQYTSYDAKEAGTYNWHMDIFLGPDVPPDMNEPRKLSLTVSLNDDYEGGEFMINMGNEKDSTVVPMQKGRVIAFPSFLIHSVRPVTKGFRKSIVIWVTGPKFK